MLPFKNVLMPLFFSSVNSRKWQSCLICDRTKLFHCDLLCKIKYIMGCDAAGGLWYHPRWRYLGCHLDFYPKLKIINKTADIEIVDYEMIKHYSAFCQRFVLFFTKKVKSTHFFQKWLDHLVFMSVKMFLSDMHTATENGRWRWKIVSENLKKNLMGKWRPPPLPPRTSDG